MEEDSNLFYSLLADQRQAALAAKARRRAAARALPQTDTEGPDQPPDEGASA